MITRERVLALAILAATAAAGIYWAPEVLAVAVGFMAFGAVVLAVSWSLSALVDWIG